MHEDWCHFTHKIWVICRSEKKRALIFVDKCGRGGEIKKSEKCINLLKSAYGAENKNLEIRAQGVKIGVEISLLALKNQ